jgi:hypothetical protein
MGHPPACPISLGRRGKLTDDQARRASARSRRTMPPLRRRIAAEEWVKPEVDPPRISRYRALVYAR